MMETIDRIWHGLTDLAAVLWFALVAIVGLFIAVGAWTQFFDAAGPPEITLAAGPKNLAYWNNAIRFAGALNATRSVKVVVIESNGSPYNLKQLLDKNADAALIQGDTITDVRQAPKLESLGAVFNDMLWLFRRRDGNEHAASMSQGIGDLLRGKRIAIGPDESGTQQLARTVLALNEITEQNSKFLPLTTGEAVRQLQLPTGSSSIDAAFFATSWAAVAVTQLCDDPHVELLGDPKAGAYRFSNDPKADAYKNSRPYLHAVELPPGFCRTPPNNGSTVVATKASLIVRDDLKLTIQYRLLEAIGQIQPASEMGIDKFPSRETPGGVPLSVAAQEYYNNPNDPFYKLNSFVAHLHFPLSINELILQMLHSLVAKFVLGVLSVVLSVLSLPLLVRLGSGFINWLRQRHLKKLREQVIRLEKELKAPPASLRRAADISLELDDLELQANDLFHRPGSGIDTDDAAEKLLKRISRLRGKLQQYIYGMHPDGPTGPDDSQNEGP